MKPFYLRFSIKTIAVALLAMPMWLSGSLFPADAATVRDVADQVKQAVAEHTGTIEAREAAVPASAAIAVAHPLSAYIAAITPISQAAAIHSSITMTATNAPIIHTSPLTPQQQQLSFPKDFSIEQDVVSLPHDRMLFVDRFSGGLYMNDLTTGRNLWSHTYAHLYSYRMLSASGKLVLIVQQQQQLQKIVLGLNGETLSTYTYPAALSGLLSDSSSDSYQLSWSAPLQPGEKERLAIQYDDEVRIYEVPWTKPLRTFKLKAVQTSTAEQIRSIHMEYQSDRLVIQYAAGSLAQTGQVFELLDTSRRTSVGNVIELPWNLQSDFQLENGQAVIYNSNDREFAPGIRGAISYPIYSRYDVATGKLLVEKTRVFTGESPQWTTQYSNGQLLLQDEQEQRLYLYDKQGKELWQMRQLSDKLRLKLIKYDHKLLYLLVETNERQFRLVKQPLI